MHFAHLRHGFFHPNHRIFANFNIQNHSKGSGKVTILSARILPVSDMSPSESLFQCCNGSIAYGAKHSIGITETLRQVRHPGGRTGSA